MKNHLIHFSVFIFSSLLLSACANKYSISTNFDKENVQEYFSVSQVKVYKDEKAIKNKYHYLSPVEGESCQEKAHHEVADEISARTETRKNAFKLGANGIVFSGCTLIENDQANKQCITTRVCYAKAYQVEQVK